MFRKIACITTDPVDHGRHQVAARDFTDAQQSFLIVLRLLPLVRLFGRLPDRASRTFADALNAATRPFHHVKYLGSVGGAHVFMAYD